MADVILLKPKRCFDAEGAVEVERQLDHRGHHHEQCDEGDAACDAAVKNRSRKIVDCLQAAAEGEDQQDHGFENERRRAEAGFGAGVVGRALVRVEADLAREFRRHRGAMRLDVADVARSPATAA